MNSIIDTVVIVVFSAFVLGIGMMFARTGTNLKSFFAGGEAVPWPIGGLSLFMSFFSAGTFVAWGSIAYQYGFVSITIQWTMAVGAMVTAFFLAPKWKKTGNLTAAEFIKQRLGITAQKTYVNIFLAVSIFSKGVVLYPVAKLVCASLGFPLMPTTVVLGFLMISYTAVGGLWAVMVTDILQFVVLLAAVLIVLPLTNEAAGGWSSFVQNAPENFFNVFNGEFNAWFIVAFSIYHIFFIGGNWTFVQRYTSVDTPVSAKKVALLFGALYIISPVIWMLPPMMFKVIDPSIMDAENAYLYVCKMVLPPGLMGLMLTGMYFSTSATANTTLNVASAVFTNDIYKSLINPAATDKQLMRVARLSSWAFGIGMILIALIIPAIGGMVEVVLSIASITAGPLLAPPIWALFSKKLSGKVTLQITISTLLLNLFLKLIFPMIAGFSFNRAEQMIMGIGIPFLLLLINELLIKKPSSDYLSYLETKTAQNNESEPTQEEVKEVKVQNRFGLRVIAGSLAFTALLVFILSFITTAGKALTAGVAVFILLAAIIPLRASKKIKIND
ncbi:sodium:solute symporter family protein [Pedobacter puniceum]|uniref:Sodium transporter n=1 Tax=Pedobacter puniceum TaxID=2666136 RepID=A0A7K0FPE8_9SPHI|nr:sodium:solute symporter family protein [Pedobacter puniceum]MRX46927.1 sodium transporter [Pedobacter puniceum]